MFTFGFKIGLMRLFSSSKSAFSDSLAVCHQLHQPFSLMAAYAKKAAFVCLSRFFKVLKVSKPINFAQITKRIVSFLPINMVDMLQRPFAHHVKPSKSMGKHLAVINSNCPVSGFSSRTGFFANQFRLVFVLKPEKITCFRLIPQKFFQLLNWDMVTLSHENEFTIKGI